MPFVYIIGDNVEKILRTELFLRGPWPPIFGFGYVILDH